MTRWTWMLPAILLTQLTSAGSVLPQAPARIPAVPLEARAAVLDAFRAHQLVAIGDAHGNQQGEAFQLALVQDPRFPFKECIR